MDIWSKKKIIPSFSSIPKDPIILCYMIHLLKFFFKWFSGRCLISVKEYLWARREEPHSNKSVRRRIKFGRTHAASATTPRHIWREERGCSCQLRLRIVLITYTITCVVKLQSFAVFFCLIQGKKYNDFGLCYAYFHCP